MYNAKIIIFVVVFAIVFGLYTCWLKPTLETSPEKRRELRRKKQKKKNAPYKKGKAEEVDGIVFGYRNIFSTKYYYFSPAEDEGHIFVTAGSGKGKTAAIFIPSLRAWVKNINDKGIYNTFFVIDISGDIEKNVSVQNKLVYEPLNKNSTPFNIFAFIDNLDTDADKRKALIQLGLLLMPDDPNASEAGKYYNTEGRKILTASLIAFYFAGYDFVDICKIIYQNDWRNLLNLIDKEQNEFASSLLTSFVGVQDTLTANSKQCTDDAISIFYIEESLASNIRRPKQDELAFTPEILETHNVFINIPDTDLEYLKILTQVITSQTLDYFSRRTLDYDHKILLGLDEAASLGNIDLLPALRKFRKRGIRVMVLTQALSDIDLTWGDQKTMTRKALMTNFDYKVILHSGDSEEQKYWADLIGKEIKENYSHTKGHSESSTFSDKMDYIIEPSELANLGDDLILLFDGGHERLHKNFYFKNDDVKEISFKTLIKNRL